MSSKQYFIGFSTLHLCNYQWCCQVPSQMWNIVKSLENNTKGDVPSRCASIQLNHKQVLLGDVSAWADRNTSHIRFWFKGIPSSSTASTQSCSGRDWASWLHNDILIMIWFSDAIKWLKRMDSRGCMSTDPPTLKSEYPEGVASKCNPMTAVEMRILNQITFGVFWSWSCRVHNLIELDRLSPWYRWSWAGSHRLVR